ncbi:hypothetical protein [Sphingobacterium multivorum]|uniref:hypothetical protein n=1 Tax=Sphingobacterium multivorum TaxID=28454 RepID=UPI0028A87114|nr:hypothetical protein [Sphingobacterium multivorum]
MLISFRFIPRSLDRPTFSCSWWPNRRSPRTPDDIGRLQGGLPAMEWALVCALDSVRPVLSQGGSLGVWGVEDSPIDNCRAAAGLHTD